MGAPPVSSAHPPQSPWGDGTGSAASRCWGWCQALGLCQATSLFPLLFLSPLMEFTAWHPLWGCAATMFLCVLEGGQAEPGGPRAEHTLQFETCSGLPLTVASHYWS